jgi:hypothetical protein
VLPVLPKLVSGCISLVTGNLTGEIANFGLNLGSYSAPKTTDLLVLAHREVSSAGFRTGNGFS